MTRERDDDGAASEYAENAESHLLTKPMEWTGSIQQLPSGSRLAVTWEGGGMRRFTKGVHEENPFIGQ